MEYIQLATQHRQSCVNMIVATPISVIVRVIPKIASFLILIVRQPQPTLQFQWQQQVSL